MTIAPGLPDVDYLHGDAASSLGGTPRHQVQAQGGWYNNGFGARVSANWRSGTRVDSLTGNDLKFSPLATFDLRLFANLGEQFELVARTLAARDAGALERPTSSIQAQGSRHGGRCRSTTSPTSSTRSAGR